VTNVGSSGRAAHPAMGERLRAARLARNLTLRELAQRLGVSPSMISQIETGRASPSVSTLYSIASELDVSLDELLFNDRRPPAGQADGSAATAGADRYVQRATAGRASAWRPASSGSASPHCPRRRPSSCT
jgi:transcriptional regulator with XRE-family HTH domain